MEYFVSAQGRAGEEWQLELLLQGFKSLGIDDQILVAVADAGDHHYPIQKNVNGHRRLFRHASSGEKRGHQRLDEIYSLQWAMENGKIGQEVCVIRPWHVPTQSHFSPFKIKDLPSVVFQPDQFFTFDLASRSAGDFWKEFNRDESFYRDRWAPLGGIICMQAISAQFVGALANIAERLIVNQIGKGRRVWDCTVDLAWAVALIEAIDLKQAYIYGDYEMASFMNESRRAPFVDYRHGMPPVFSRSMFTLPDSEAISFGDPIEVLAGCINTANSHILAKLAASMISDEREVIEI